MIAAGQDFLRTKQGVTNTYQRGDLNVLDYRRIQPLPRHPRLFRPSGRLRRSDRRAVAAVIEHVEIAALVGVGHPPA